MIRSGPDFCNNGDGYVVIHFRSPHDVNGNPREAWVAFDIDTYFGPIAVSDTEGELQGDKLSLTVWVPIKKVERLTSRMILP